MAAPKSCRCTRPVRSRACNRTGINSPTKTSIRTGGSPASTARSTASSRTSSSWRSGTTGDPGRGRRAAAQDLRGGDARMLDQRGIIDSLLVALHLPAVLWLVDGKLPLISVALVNAWVAIPLEIEEAATVDGASPWRVFARIALPLALNGTVTAGIIIFLIAWGEFLYAISFLVDPTQYPLSVLIASQLGQYGNNWPALIAIAVATGLPILVIFLISYRKLREGLALGSIR